MATCEDCLHFGVCKFKDSPAPLSDSYIRESECIEKRCSDFKDRSRFVELPCGAGDTVYYIVNVNGEDTISSAVVDEVAIYKSGTIGYDCGVGEIGFSSKSIGKRVFLTQAEAEQTLAKRNQPDNTPQ